MEALLGPYRRLTPRRMDMLLFVAVVVAAATGLLSWGVGTGWARWVTVVHALAGLSLFALAVALPAGVTSPYLSGSHTLSELAWLPRRSRMRCFMRAWAVGVPSWKVPKSLSIGTGRLP